MPEKVITDALDAQQQSGNALAEPRWPAVAAFATVWLCPATSARRTLHVRLWAAYAVHLVAAVLTFVLMTIVLSLADYQHAMYYLLQIGGEFTSDRWQDATLALGASLLGIEITFLLLALILMPWGARDERLRSSWSHALRVTWLHTSHLLPTVLLVGILSVVFSEARRSYNKTHTYPTRPSTRLTPPARPSGAYSPESQAWSNYDTASAEYARQATARAEQWRRAYAEWSRQKPFLLDYGEALIVWIGVGCFCWLLWAMYRAVGATRRLSPIAQWPLCEFCGYNLTATPIESRCPECGHPAIDSLGPDVRPGTAWDRSEDVGRLRAWWRCGVDAAFRPSQLGRQIRTRAGTVRHRAFLAMHLPLVFLFAAMGMASCVLHDWRVHPGSAREPFLIWGIPPMLGATAMLAALVIAGLAASVVGLVYSLRNERNLLGAAMQMACYLGLYVTVWAAFGSLLAVVCFVAEGNHGFRAVAREQFNMVPEVLLFYIWLVLNLLWLGGYAILVWKGTGAAQYANR